MDNTEKPPQDGDVLATQLKDLMVKTKAEERVLLSLSNSNDESNDHADKLDRAYQAATDAEQEYRKEMMSQTKKEIDIRYDNPEIQLHVVAGSRYGNVGPYKSNMIPGSDMSWIQVGSNRKVIVGSAPTQVTIFDFFRKVIEYNVRTIFCLAKEYEKWSKKVDPYWPANPIQSFFATGFLINYDGEDEKIANGLVKKHLIAKEIPMEHIKRPLREHKFTLILYEAWPDFGIPIDHDPFIKIVEMAQTALQGDSNVLIHCSAGIGRTGVLCGLLRMLNLKETPATSVWRLRCQRRGMVQTEQQYLFMRLIYVIMTADSDEAKSALSIAVKAFKEMQNQNIEVEKQQAIATERLCDVENLCHA